VPRFLALYGLPGYAIFLAGPILEILGHNVGVAPSIPGGLLEIAFASSSSRKDSPQCRTATTTSWPATSRLP
jgi:hypothetical protein